jgi:aspartokinase
MKRLISAFLAGAMALSLAACGGSASTSTAASSAAASAAPASSVAADSDLAYIQSNGKMVIGYTVYEPMNYTDADGSFTGFDTELATAGVNVDMIVQAGASVGTADISFTVPESAVKQVQNTLLDKQEVLGYHSFDVDTTVGKVAVVGVGMKTHAGLAAKFFQALSDEGINVLMISTSEIRIAALVPLDQLNDAVKALHTAYGLDADQIEAVVYGGTGR